MGSLVVTHAPTIVWDLVGRSVGGGVIYENFLINLDMNLKLFSKLKFISLKGKKKHGRICDELNEYMGCNGSETNFVKKIFQSLRIKKM